MKKLTKNANNSYKIKYMLLFDSGVQSLIV